MNRHQRRAEASQERGAAENEVDLVNKLARTCRPDWLILRYGRSSQLEQVFCSVLHADNAPAGATRSCCRAQAASFIGTLRGVAVPARAAGETETADLLEALARDTEKALAAVQPGHRLLVHVSGQEVAYLNWPAPN